MVPYGHYYSHQLLPLWNLHFSAPKVVHLEDIDSSGLLVYHGNNSRPMGPYDYDHFHQVLEGLTLVHFSGTLAGKY